MTSSVASGCEKGTAPALRPGDLRLLADYHWPGNIRELGAVIDQAVILGGGRTLDVATALGIDAERFRD
ncbi:MAG: hypothetical protein ACOVJ6_01835 [Pirellulales bacterium]